MITLETSLAWLTAVGTLLAAIVPGVLYLLERRTRIEAQKLARAAQDRAVHLELRALTARARRIRVRPEIAETVVDLSGGPDVARYTAVTVENKSDDAVYEVTVGGHPVFQKMPLEVLERGASEHIPAMAGHAVPADQPPDLWVEFTDSDGRRWKRYVGGTVEEVTPTSSP